MAQPFRNTPRFGTGQCGHSVRCVFECDLPWLIFFSAFHGSCPDRRVGSGWCKKTLGSGWVGSERVRNLESRVGSCHMVFKSHASDRVILTRSDWYTEKGSDPCEMDPTRERILIFFAFHFLFCQVPAAGEGFVSAIVIIAVGRRG